MVGNKVCYSRLIWHALNTRVSESELRIGWKAGCHSQIRPRCKFDIKMHWSPSQTCVEVDRYDSILKRS